MLTSSLRWSVVGMTLRAHLPGPQSGRCPMGHQVVPPARSQQAPWTHCGQGNAVPCQARSEPRVYRPLSLCRNEAGRPETSYQEGGRGNRAEYGWQLVRV